MKHLHGLIAVLLALAVPPSYGSSKDPGKVIAGWVEKISLSEQPFVIKAKLDTGAKTSSIHAINVEKFSRDDRSWVRFDLILEDEAGEQHTVHMEKPRVRRVRIKIADGDHDRRSVVKLELCFDGRKRKAEFTLANRSEYIYSVLLGRDFLEGIAVVDPQSAFLTMARCK